MRVLVNIFTVLILLVTGVAKANNKTIEGQIVNYLNEKQQEQLYLLEKLVNINSGTTNLPGVRQIGDLLRPEFEKLRFTVRWVEGPPSMGRAGTFIAEHPGKGCRVLLIGHLDTVFPVSRHFQQFKQADNLATGPGVIDDKGGDLVILFALKALQAANALDDADITVVLSGDEEDSGKPTTVSRQALVAAAKKADIALDFEWAITADTATIARRGVTNWRLTTTGNEAHSSTIFQKPSGFGAIYELARILDTVQGKLRAEKYLSFSPGLILGGTTVTYDKAKSEGMAFGKGNIIAKTAMAKGDLRFLTEEQKITAEEKITAAVNAHLPGTTATISFQDGIPAMPPKSANLALLKKYSQASIKLGFGEVNQLDPGLRGAGDISHIANLMKASLAGLGPVGTGAHSDQETLDIRSLFMQTKRAALFIHDLTRCKTVQEVTRAPAHERARARLLH